VVCFTRFAGRLACVLENILFNARKHSNVSIETPLVIMSFLSFFFFRLLRSGYMESYEMMRDARGKRNVCETGERLLYSVLKVVLHARVRACGLLLICSAPQRLRDTAEPPVLLGAGVVDHDGGALGL
jgi:hypothetical protein